MDSRYSQTMVGVTKRSQTPFIDVNSDPASDGSNILLLGVDALNQQLRNLFSSYPGAQDRIFGPDLPINLYSLLEEPMGESTAALIEHFITDGIVQSIPQISIFGEGVSVTPNSSLPGYECSVQYRVNATAEIETLKFQMQI